MRRVQHPANTSQGPSFAIASSNQMERRSRVPDRPVSCWSGSLRRDAPRRHRSMFDCGLQTNFISLGCCFLRRSRGFIVQRPQLRDRSCLASNPDRAHVYGGADSPRSPFSGSPGVWYRRGCTDPSDLVGEEDPAQFRLRDEATSLPEQRVKSPSSISEWFGIVRVWVSPRSRIRQTLMWLPRCETGWKPKLLSIDRTSPPDSARSFGIRRQLRVPWSQESWDCWQCPATPGPRLPGEG